MKTLLAPLEEINAYIQARDAIRKRYFPLHISGCVESEKCHVIYGLGREEKWRVIITSDEIRAREIVEDYKMFDGDVLYYPAKDIIFFDADVHGGELSYERLKCAYHLCRDDGGTIVTTIDAGLERVQSLKYLKEQAFYIKINEQISLPELTGRLTTIGYIRTEQVEKPGDYAVRGGIMDIFPVAEQCPYRIDFWGDEVDTIRSFDVESQRSMEKVDEVFIFPASELILSGDLVKAGMKLMEEDKKKTGEKLKKKKNHEAYNRLSDTIKRAFDTYEIHGGHSGLEGFLTYFNIETGSVFEYFGEDVIFFMDEPQKCVEKLRTSEIEFTESMKTRLLSGYILPGQMDMIFSAETVMAVLMQKKMVILSMMDKLPGFSEIKDTYYVPAQPIGSYNKHFELLVEDVERWKEQKYRVLILCPSTTRGMRICRDLEDYGVISTYREIPDIELKPGQVMVSYGYQKRGFKYSNIKFVVVTESDIFGSRIKKKRIRRKKYDGRVIQTFNELNVGDYVVHENYGLGIYRGIEKITTDGVVKDYIKVEYGDGGNLYVVASNLGVLQKYAGGETDKKIKLNSLTSPEWRKTKAKVKGAVEEVAMELVTLYAKRQNGKGYSFGPDTVWQTEFEELFPYEETGDQLAAIEDTKRDMESDKIMDRLICGDVGYGKTEIALRAAFKAVNDGKQVAFLVPTTILAQQHYNTLIERIGDFPIKVGLLSRFRTPTQQKKTLEMTKKGEVDIIVGTHRLLSKDVSFKDLGLLIVDEEQRFGVTHKEKIKQMRGNIDVLTLSATPIPRTMHMSLIGVRDMSVLEEPPVDRMPVQTFVMEHNDEMIREAINRELARGGQVYYVYNRVDRIDEVAAKVSDMLPEASVAYAHGQMKERELEDIMLSFISGDIDILVSTTIIETGMDIPNVNTIIIDHADRMGLSQLYQLRGRVGRSNRTAYAFIMYQRGKILKEEAEKRLAAIRDYTELGSGIKVAMRDLEIRGAGTLLGKKQSGHMAAVGYDLYCKMLSQAVEKLKGEKEEKEFETTLDISVSAYIPTTYIKSEYQKLDMYKRIALIDSDEELMDMQDELKDRFGKLPSQVVSLLKVAYLKNKAHDAGIQQISEKSDGVRLFLNDMENVSTQKFAKFIESYDRAIKYVQNGNSDAYLLYAPPKKKMIKSGAQRMKADNKTDKKKDILDVLFKIVEDIGGIYESEKKQN